jgi:multicomponent Na+:H+ antiporter subunit A
MGIDYAIASFFVLALAAPWLHRLFRGASGWVFALLPAALTAYFASFVETIAAGTRIGPSILEWAPSLGLNLSFFLDGLSLVFALLITSIGALILVYSGGYLAGHSQLGRFYAYLLAFTGSMLGMVVADNVLTLFVFWELTSLTSFLLIGFHHERTEVRSAAWQALIVTGAGGLALLVGLLLLAHAGGTFELSQLLTRGEVIREHGYYLPILSLVLVGAFTKSAQFPFHFWLPNAMEAPTPVSAFLHSATMVKAGIYLLARLHPVLAGTAEWFGAVTSIGAATMLIGGFLAVIQFDLKRILAYSTISSLGALTMLLGLPNSGGHAVTAVVVFLLAHAFYKGALFMIAGAIDHSTGTRDIRKLGSLMRAMPFTAIAAVIAGLSMAGVAAFLGFIGKELLFEALWNLPDGRFALVFVGVVTASLAVVVAGLIILKPFFGPRVATEKALHEVAPSMWLGPIVLALVGLATGIGHAPLGRWFIQPAASAISGERQETALALWHGFTPPLLLGATSLAVGIAIYFVRERIGRAVRRGEPLLHWGPEAWYRLSISGLNSIATGSVGVLQSGYLRYYILFVLIVLVGLGGGTLLALGGPVIAGNWRDVKYYEIGLAALILSATLMTVLSKSRITSIAAVGVVGYSIALQFVLFGAPDVAMTQFLIETLTIILFLLVFYRRPARDVSRRLTRLRDAVIAIAIGTLMGTLVLFGAENQFEEPISRYYSAHADEKAHGRNIVNVILVDFRALDTLGEIAILAAAGIGVYTLLRLRLGADRKRPAKEHQLIDVNATPGSVFAEKGGQS